MLLRATICALFSALAPGVALATEKAPVASPKKAAAPFLILCQRLEVEVDGRPETFVNVAGRILRFVEVEPPPTGVSLGLTEHQAAELLRQAQAEAREATLPQIFRSVGEAHRKVARFFLQDRLVDPELYRRLSGGKDPNAVSFNQATAFLRELNTRCRGVARFALPTEEQWVAAARPFYQLAAGGLPACSDLRTAGSRWSVTQLFGRSWQITSSRCLPFAGPTIDPCDERFMVRKGGTLSSPTNLECLPELRSVVPPDIAAPETSIRLVLVEEGTEAR